MPLTTAQLAILKTELQTDPRGYGYNAAGRNDTAMAAIINTARDGTNAPTTPTADGGAADGSIRLILNTVDTSKVRAVVTQSAFDGLVTATRNYFTWLTGSNTITGNASLLQSLAGVPTANGSIWATGDRTAMNAAMDAVLRKFGSRAEEKFGQGVSVTIDDVGNALNS